MKTEVETALAELKKALEGTDIDGDQVRAPRSWRRSARRWARRCTPQTRPPRRGRRRGAAGRGRAERRRRRRRDRRRRERASDDERAVDGRDRRDDDGRAGDRAGRWRTRDSGREATGERRAEEPRRPVIRDRRRIDPRPARCREPAEAAGARAAPPRRADAAGDAERRRPADELRPQLAERTARPAAAAGGVRQLPQAGRARPGRGPRAGASASVLTELLPVLDDIGRAREHGELTAASSRSPSSSGRRSASSA